MFRLLTTVELAQHLRIPKRTVCKLAQEGRIPSAFKIGKHWRFKEDRIIQWIEEAAGNGPARADTAQDGKCRAYG